MPILGTLIKNGIKIRESLDQEYASPYDLQKLELKKLLITAAGTDFGKRYKFKDVLKGFKSPKMHAFYEGFKKAVPIHDYNKIQNEWWYRNLKGEKDVCWPGTVKYFALSSGTSEASSKHIPITKDMLKAIRKTSQRHILTLSNYDLPDHLFNTGILMLGGTTHLHYNGTYFEGDLSGITASQLPFWFQRWYKPGQKIAKTRDWGDKLDEITHKARDWNIGIIVGVPAWIQILLEKIISYYRVDNIHEIWPDLMIFVHGGVSFEPYKKGFEKLLGKPLYYIETYLASEGFLAFQAFKNRESMRMVLNNGIFYEFIPFDEHNFDPEGNVVEDPQTLSIDQVECGKEYAILLSTCAGAWRYMIGDVIKFVSKENSEILITGRTKHFLSLCGEHLSVDNMNKAVQIVEEKLDLDIKEFTVSGIPDGTLFAHHWYIGTDDPANPAQVTEELDKALKELNDDYQVERNHALKQIYVDILPTGTFYKWMKLKGKEGGQNKFPRVMNKSLFNEWRSYLETQAVN